MLRALEKLAAAVLVLACAAPAARATWSIAVVDNRTREVCLASATCLEAFDLKRALAVVVPEVGAGAAQSVIDQTGGNRRRIWDGLLAGESPQQILDALVTQDGAAQTRQYGIVALDHAPATFSGFLAGNAKKGVVGTAGDLSYAIQGNILAGTVVVDAAEAALLATPGDITARVMAAMEAAAAMGGDGRCSCSTLQPQSCGAPPPSFTHSSYTAFIVAARVGDTRGSCAPNPGCANGAYFLDLKVISGPSQPDPVGELRQLYDVWRTGMNSRVSQAHSYLDPGATSLVADGRSQTLVRIRLANINGNPLWPYVTSGVEIEQVSGPAAALVGTPGAHGLNRFGFLLTATDQPGVASYRVTIVQGQHRTRLIPDLELRVDPLAELHVGRDAVGALEDGRIPFHLNVPAAADRPFLLFGTASGTSPGTPFAGGILPLNQDRFLLATMHVSGETRLRGGTLDATGHGETSLVLTPGLLARWAGRRLDWSAVLLGGPLHVTPAVGFDVVP